MKKTTLILLLAIVWLTGYAQSDVKETTPHDSTTVLRYGYLSYDAVMQSMPEYADMTRQLSQLRSYYDAEMARVEKDFNKKYEDFLDGQRNFPKSILQKRQSELQEMLDKNIAFKKESLQLLKETEQSMRGTLVSLIDMAVEQIGLECGYAFILNTDAKATPWLNPGHGENITDAVIQHLSNNGK